MPVIKDRENNSEFIIFKTEDENISVDVRMIEHDVWLTQDQLATLYGVERPGITQHIKNILSEGELKEISVSKKFLRTAADGKKYNTKHYKKYQQKTLSEAEENYLESLKIIERKTQKKELVPDTY